MTVGAFCSPVVAYIDQNASVLDAARLMRSRHTGSLVVVADAAHGACNPVGIVTDRDLVVEVLAEDFRHDLVAVKDVMSQDLIVAAPSDALYDTVKRMRAKGVRRVPVTDGQHAVIGVLSVDDVLSVLAATLSEVDALIVQEQGYERATRARPVASPA